DWDHLPGLGFKAFLMRQRGAAGAVGNLYSSLYLWQSTAAAAEFIAGERFRAVADAFGRPLVETWLALDARGGKAAAARSARIEEAALSPDADLAAVHAEEAARNEAAVRDAETVAIVAALDLATWRILRIRLSVAAPRATDDGVGFEVLYLARPGWAALSGG